MNFKTIILLMLLSTGCGVKGPPRPPAGTAVPSYLDSYLKKSNQAALESSEEESNKEESKQKVSK